MEQGTDGGFGRESLKLDWKDVPPLKYEGEPAEGSAKKTLSNSSAHTVSREVLAVEPYNL